MQKIALVTGARRGIGLAIAARLSREGYAVVLSAVSDEAGEALAACESGCEYVRCNISKEADRQALFSYIKEKYGRLDLIVNNAGIAPKERKDLLLAEEDSFNEVLSVNLSGTFFMCKEAALLMLETMQEQHYTPRIVNVSSISSYTSSVMRGEYCISKAGVSMVTKLFADRLAGEGIPVFEVSPGIIETDMTAKVKDAYSEKIAAGLTPVPRMGKPEDCADCVAALASGLLDFAVGQVIHADGGFHLRRL